MAVVHVHPIPLYIPLIWKKMTLNFGYRTPKAQLKFVACQTNLGNPSRSYISKKRKEILQDKHMFLWPCKLVGCLLEMESRTRIWLEDFLEKETNFFLHRLWRRLPIRSSPFEPLMSNAHTVTFTRQEQPHPGRQAHQTCRGVWCAWGDWLRCRPYRESGGK